MLDGDPSSSTPSGRICARCTNPARYRCPRCMAPACSLVCSQKHKADTGCTGERNKADYIPINAYGWGTMMRDYCYLEEVGRKVGDWGSEIVRGGFNMENDKRGRDTRTRGRGRPHKQGAGRAKRDVLKAQLEALDIDVDLLSNGMERRSLNHSTYDQKSRCLLLTIEFKFYPPSAIASTSSTAPPSRAPYTLVSHRNPISTTLLSALQRHVPWHPSKSQKQRENPIPDWVPPLINPHPDDPEGFSLPHCYIRARLDLPHTTCTDPKTPYYHKLDPTSSISVLLRDTCFVEFPAIHVFDPDASSFQGTVIDKAGSLAWLPEDEQGGKRAPKRRKISKIAGRDTITGLVGGYGSESDPESGDVGTEKTNGLAMLGNYSGSDDEMEPPSDTEVVRIGDRSQDSDEEPSGSDVEDTPIDPARLLELVKQAQGQVDEDTVDWGDEWDFDAGSA
ncbi:hypothetical protein F5I97DRAFT_1804600 [Phlebopus sp. FC_14]|nr:hypothetical protein F5I97DRAFT_1804600 [Phlebopus sp. FC_14]